MAKFRCPWCSGKLSTIKVQYIGGRDGAPRACPHCKKKYLNRAEKKDLFAKITFVIMCICGILIFSSQFVDLFAIIGIPNPFEFVFTFLILLVLKVNGVDLARMSVDDVKSITTYTFCFIVVPIIYFIIYFVYKQRKVIARVDPAGKIEIPFPKHCKVRITLLKRVSKYVFFDMCMVDAVFGRTYGEQDVGTATIPVAVNDIEKLDKTTLDATICFIKEDENSLTFANLGQTFTLLHKNKPFATCTITEVYEQEDSEEI